MAKVSAKKYMTGGMTNPNKGQMMTAAGVKSAKPKSKGSGDANPGKVPTGATPVKKWVLLPHLLSLKHQLTKQMQAFIKKVDLPKRSNHG